MGYTLVEIAERAGLDPAFVDRLGTLGILEPVDGTFNEGDVRRARIVQSLDAAGLPIDGLGAAIQAGHIDLGFVDAPAYNLFAGLTDTTFGETAARSGVPLEVVLAIREAAGASVPSPDDRMRQVELEVLPALEMALRQGVRPTVVEGALRAAGESARRLAEIQSEWWMTDILQPIFASGGGATEVTERTGDFADAYGAVDDAMILGLYHGHQAHTWMKNIFEGFEAVLTRAGLYAPSDRPPAICFLDLSGYTRLTEERGDAAAADLAGRLSKLVQRTSVQHGGKPVKWLGDGVMFHFREPGPGVLAALEMVEGARDENLPPAHVGLHAGPVIFQDGDYFGRTVNTAARIADYARQGEVLVSDEVVTASPGLEGVRFEAIGPVELKGITETIPLNVARRV
ncbi:MAG TPA: adenylate/guanylate cyclase domain-containing protein [Candidatus Limnocylindrales bacterium]|nr:adenylate/guanylate cyclase domain-containing protein [Candidatus Limnocylindrales bacterium]